MNKTAKKKKRDEAFDQGSNGFALAGFIMGILGLVTFNFLFALLGLIFSLVAFRRMRRSGYYGEKGFARTGLVLSIIGVVLVGGLTTLFILPLL